MQFFMLILVASVFDSQWNGFEAADAPSGFRHSPRLITAFNDQLEKST